MLGFIIYLLRIHLIYLNIRVLTWTLSRSLSLVIDGEKKVPKLSNKKIHVQTQIQIVPFLLRDQYKSRHLKKLFQRKKS